MIVFLVRARPFDVEGEIGHALMALGMAAMLAPPDFQTTTLLRWNIFLFAFVSLWFAGRLLTRKPLLAFLRASTERSLQRADLIHVFTSICMSWMFLEMGSMALSMTAPATYLNSAFFVAFAYLLLSYARDVSKDLQTTSVDWLKLGADLAHVLMNGVMSWMFIEMITMTMRMQGA
jgi:uncharacterized protein DUF5134